MPRLAWQPGSPAENWRAVQRTLPPALWALLQRVRQAAQARGWPLYVVGGFVRDWLLGQLTLDLDLVVEPAGNAGVMWPAIALARALARELGGRVTEHRAFGTAKWWLPPAPQLAARLGLPPGEPTGVPAHLDFVTARAEHYPHPAALPQVRPANLRADLHRRDFTINAMALSLTPQPGVLHDPFGGLQDLRGGVLRALHARSFRDDPTRMFRAVRYAVRYRLRLSPETRAQWPQGLEHVPALSGDRVRHELDRLLDEPLAGRMVRRLGAWGLARAVHPRLPAGRAAARRVARGHTPQAAAVAQAWGLAGEPAEGVPRVTRYALWWATLPPGAIDALSARLRPPAALRNTARAAARLWRTRRVWAAWPPARFTFHLEAFPLEAVLAVRLLTDDPALQARLDRFAQEWRHVRPGTTGHDLRALGLPPGPHYAAILRALRAAWLEGRVHSTAQEAQLRAQLVQAARDATAPAPVPPKPTPHPEAS